MERRGWQAGPACHPEPRVQTAGELTGDDAGHDEVGRGHGWAQRCVAVRVEVVDVTGVALFAGDKVSPRRSFGRRWFRLFPAATERGNKGEMIRGLQGFLIEAEEERGRPIPRELRRAEAVELELDLELGRLWRGTGAQDGCFGEWDSEW